MMTDEEALAALKAGETLTYGIHGRNLEVIAFFADLEAKGLITTSDISRPQETRREARWNTVGSQVGIPTSEIRQIR